MHFTIESRQLGQASSTVGYARSIVIEASDPDAALWEYVRRNDSELVSFSTPARGRESIATVKKDDSVYLVRVYEA